MKTTTRPKYLNLTAAKARHLHETESLLVVVACEPQPPAYDDIYKMAGIGYSLFTDHHGTPGVFRVGGPVWAVRELDPNLAMFGISAPLGKPGDVVLCREPWRYSVEHDNYYYEADSKGVGALVYTMLSGLPKQSIPASEMPEESIRLRPVLATVECRRVASLNDDEACQTGIVDGSCYWAGGAAMCDANGNLVVNQFRDDWNRHYRRRWPEYAFERAWGFFYTLTKE